MTADPKFPIPPEFPRSSNFTTKWVRESEFARPHTGEMLTYLRALLDDPNHPGVRRCARELIKQIEKDAELARD